jgi:rhodanese-related sulfurtransferase
MTGYPILLNIAGAALWFFVGINLAYAGSQPIDGIETILKDNNPAQPCGRDKPSKPKPVNFISVQEVKPDMDCAIMPNELAQQSHQPDTLLADTRSQSDYAGYHIDGAVNINPVQLRSKPFLSDKAVMLIGDGKSERQLYIECKRLITAGYKRVRVLRGGMLAWLSTGHVVAGQSPDPRQLGTLSPEELWQASQFKPNLIFITTGQKALHKQIKGSVFVSSEQPETIQATIKQHIRHANSRFVATVILVTGKLFNSDALSRAISPVPLLVYSGTAEAYGNHLSQQVAVWDAYAHGPKQPPGCRR